MQTDVQVTKWKGSAGVEMIVCFRTVREKPFQTLHSFNIKTNCMLSLFISEIWSLGPKPRSRFVYILIYSPVPVKLIDFE